MLGGVGSDRGIHIIANALLQSFGELLVGQGHLFIDCCNHVTE